MLRAFGSNINRQINQLYAGSVISCFKYKVDVKDVSPSLVPLVVDTEWIITGATKLCINQTGVFQEREKHNQIVHSVA